MRKDSLSRNPNLTSSTFEDAPVNVVKRQNEPRPPPYPKSKPQPPKTKPNPKPPAPPLPPPTPSEMERQGTYASPPTSSDLERASRRSPEEESGEYSFSDRLHAGQIFLASASERDRRSNYDRWQKVDKAQFHAVSNLERNRTRGNTMSREEVLWCEHIENLLEQNKMAERDGFNPYCLALLPEYIQTKFMQNLCLAIGAQILFFIAMVALFSMDSVQAILNDNLTLSLTMLVMWPIAALILWANMDVPYYRVAALTFFNFTVGYFFAFVSTTLCRENSKQVQGWCGAQNQFLLVFVCIVVNYTFSYYGNLYRDFAMIDDYRTMWQHRYSRMYVLTYLILVFVLNGVISGNWFTGFMVTLFVMCHLFWSMHSIIAILGYYSPDDFFGAVIRIWVDIVAGLILLFYFFLYACGGGGD